MRSILRKEGDFLWQKRAKDADALRPDPRSYFQAINNLRKLRAGDNASPIQLADADGGIIPDIGWNLQKFGEYYSSIFYDSSMPCKPVHQPATGVRDDEPFSTEDVRAAIQKQKVGGAVGQDGISSEVLRAGSDILAGWLSSFFNVIRQLQHCPSRPDYWNDCANIQKWQTERSPEELQTSNAIVSGSESPYNHNHKEN